MKFNLEQYLYPIDQSFANKKPRDVMIIYAMIIGVLFAFSYLFFWESSEAEYNAAKVERQKIEKLLRADEQYLQVHPESEIAAIEQQTQDINQQTLAVRDKNEYIKYRISQISELFYNEKAWGAYINSISRNAKKYNIKMALLTNKRSLDKAKFGHVLDIEVQASGRFSNMVKFINSMEQSDLVIDLHDMNLSAQEVLTADINSAVWGITY